MSLVGALVNAIVLLVGGTLVLTQAIPALFEPGTPDAKGMLLLALLGVAVNGAAVLRLRSGATLNERVVTWHLIEDVLGWVAVLVVSLVMLVVELPILDPILSIAITLWVGWNALLNLRRTIDLFLQAVPEGVDITELQRGLRYGAYLTLETWSRFVAPAGFELIEHYFRPPGRPRAEQPWLATVWRAV